MNKWNPNINVPKQAHHRTVKKKYNDPSTTSSFGLNIASQPIMAVSLVIFVFPFFVLTHRRCKRVFRCIALEFSSLYIHFRCTRFLSPSVPSSYSLSFFFPRCLSIYLEIFFSFSWNSRAGSERRISFFSFFLCAHPSLRAYVSETNSLYPFLSSTRWAPYLLPTACALLSTSNVFLYSQIVLFPSILLCQPTPFFFFLFIM